jgi:hypothetical protein
MDSLRLDQYLLSPYVMPKSRQLGSYAGRKIARRLTRSIPYIGAIIALATLGSAIRRKGWVRGAIHSGLDAIPYVGGAKNLAEVVRGRDFFPDKVSSR